MADKVTTELANAARRHLARLSPIGDEDVALRKALDAFDAQQIEWASFPPRLDAAKLSEIVNEELHSSAFAGSDAALMAAMFRVANYANHLSDTLVALAREVDLINLLRERVDASENGFDDPAVRNFAEIVSALTSEFRVRHTPPAAAKEST